MSERRACRALGQPRSTQRYALKQPEKDRSLIESMREIVARRPRFGCPRVHQELERSGWSVSEGRVHRLWKKESMQVPRRQRKRRRLPSLGGSHNSCVRHRPLRRNHVWSYDFVSDRTEDGRQLKLLVVIDEFTRECLTIEVARSFSARDVRLVLQYLFAVRGAPQHIRSDNGKLCKPGQPAGRRSRDHRPSHLITRTRTETRHAYPRDRPRQIQERGLHIPQRC